MNFLSYFDFFHDKKKARYLVVGLLILFIIFTTIVYFLGTTVIDIEFSEEMQEHSNPLLDNFMKAVSWFGTNWVAGAMAVGGAILLLLIRHKVEALYLMIAFASVIITFGLKILVNRPRPTEDMVNILEKAQHQSFPSGHTQFYVTFFGFVIFLMLRHKHFSKALRIGIIAFCGLLIAVVPFSRVYLGAHWFTDVAAGFILGLIMLYFLIVTYLKKAVKEESKKQDFEIVPHS